MTFWTVLACMALGYLLRMANDRPNRFADVDALIAQQRDRARAYSRGDA